MPMTAYFPIITGVTWGDEEDVEASHFTDAQRFTHNWLKPGTYTVTVAWELDYYDEGTEGMEHVSGTWSTVVEVTDQPLRAYGLKGAPEFDVDEASTVRRAGRKVWAGSRQVANRWRLKSAEDRAAQADEAAARMKARVRGRERARTLHTVPAPWIVPGDVVDVELTDGAGTQAHIVEATTVPLLPDPGGMTVETSHRDLA